MNHFDIILNLKNPHMDNIVRKTLTTMRWKFGEYSVRVAYYSQNTAVPRYRIKMFRNEVKIKGRRAFSFSGLIDILQSMLDDASFRELNRQKEAEVKQLMQDTFNRMYGNQK